VAIESRHDCFRSIIWEAAMISLLSPTALHRNFPASLRRITNLIRVLLVCDRG